MEDKIVYVPVSVDLKAQTNPTADSIVVFDNGEIRLFSEAWPIAIATSYLKPTPLSELLKEKHEQIKELYEALEAISKITFPWDKTDDAIISKAKSILQKHNSITNK